MLRVLLLNSILCFGIVTNFSFDVQTCMERVEQVKLKHLDPNYKYFFIDTGDDIKNFESANRVCQLCFDGSLLEYNETKVLPEFMLNWIGMRKLAGEIQFKWSNGEPVDNWQTYAFKFKKQHVDPKLNYSVVAYKNGSLITWIATKDTAFETTGRMSAMIDNVSPTLFYSYILNKPLVVTCKRPIRNECHHWRYAEPHCVWDERFGCHRHAWLMFHQSDSDMGRCEERQPERMAFRCSNSSCITCEVGQWSQWSMCSAKTCRDGGGVRKRNRRMLSQTCPEDLYYISLTDIANCTVSGCDVLQQDFMFENENGSFVNVNNSFF